MAERTFIKGQALPEVLYLSYDGLTDPLGESQILPYLSGLSEKGYAITIVSFEKSTRFETSKQRVLAHCKAYKINWVPLHYHKYPPIISTLYDLSVLRRTVLQLHRKTNFSIVHCRSYVTALIGLWLKKNFYVKFIFDMRGFWVDERVDGGLWNLKNPVFNAMYKYFKKREKDFIRNADSIIVLTDAAKREILSWNLNTNLTTIPCCVDLKQFSPSRFTDADKKEIRFKLGLSYEDYVLLYLGSLGTWYLYEEMISFFRELKKIYPKAKFLFITQDNDQVKTDPDFRNLTVARNDVPKYIFACDASICFIKPSFSKKGSSATKMAEVLAMGIPMITNAGWGDVEFLKMEVENIHVLNGNNENSVAEFLKRAQFRLPNKFFNDFFSLEKGVEKYLGVYKNLLDQRDLLNSQDKIKPTQL